MKELTLNGHTLLVVEVPEGAFEIRIHASGRLIGWKENTWEESEWLKLPPGPWQIIGPGLASEIREEDVVEGLVERYCECYKDYSSTLGGLAAHSLPTRLASLHSFIRANELEVDKICLLIKLK